MNDAPVSDAPSEAPAEPRTRALSWLLVPLLGFLALAGLFYVRLGAGDASVLPSAMIGKPAPQFTLPPIEGGPIAGAPDGLATPALATGVTLVNVWASWCGPCREEHPVLMGLAKDPRVRVVGINYKDQAANARAFLAEHGNPFAAIGADTRGRTAIDWGVYGVPETYLVKDGAIVLRHVGPLTDEVVRAKILPVLPPA